MLKLVIGNKNYSSWSLRPWLLLSHHAIPFEEVLIPLYVPSFDAAIAEFNKAGKVPVLHDGDLVIWDSLAILEYVSDRYLDGGGWPEDVQARAVARACSAEMHSGFGELRSKMPMNCRASGRRVPMSVGLERDIARIDEIWRDCRERYGDSGPWLFGEFSIADCMFAPVVTRFQTYGVTTSEVSQDYMRRLLAHASVQQWMDAARLESETIPSSEVGA